MCYSHILFRNAQIDHRHCLLLNLVTDIRNFLGTMANGISVKWAMADKARLVYMAPDTIIVYNKCK